MINVFQPDLGPRELDAVTAVLAGHRIGRGPQVKAFEKAWAAHLGCAREHVTSGVDVHRGRRVTVWSSQTFAVGRRGARLKLGQA